MAERLNAAVLKTVDGGNVVRGFESPPFRSPFRLLEPIAQICGRFGLTRQLDSARPWTARCRWKPSELGEHCRAIVARGPVSPNAVGLEE